MFQTPDSIPAVNGSMGPASARQRGNDALGRWLRSHPDIAQRVQVFEAIADETHAAHEGALGATNTTHERKLDASAALAWAQKDAEDAGGALSPEQRKDHEANIAAARAANEAAHERAHGTNRAQAAARNALNAIIVKANALAPDAKPRLVHVGFKGDPAKVVSQQVATIADLKAEVDKVRRAPLPKEDIVNQLLGSLANDAKLRISLNSRRPEIIVPVTTVPAEPTGDAIPTAPDALALMYAIFPDAVEAAVTTAVEERYATVGLALDPLAKADRLERLAAEILAAERIIAETIVVAFKAGQVIAPPEGLSAEALLGIE